MKFQMANNYKILQLDSMPVKGKKEEFFTCFTYYKRSLLVIIILSFTYSNVSHNNMSVDHHMKKWYKCTDFIQICLRKQFSIKVGLKLTEYCSLRSLNLAKIYIISILERN